MSFVLFFSFDVTFDFLSVSSHTCPFPKRKKEKKKILRCDSISLTILFFFVGFDVLRLSCFYIIITVV